MLKAEEKLSVFDRRLHDSYAVYLKHSMLPERHRENRGGIRSGFERVYKSYDNSTNLTYARVGGRGEENLRKLRSFP